MVRTDQRPEPGGWEPAGVGADPLRVEALECARQFKRSWVQMAAVLSRVKQQRAHEAWGYGDLYAYCAQELHIKRATVDKLTGSYGALEQHAPALIRSDGANQPLPSLDAVDYFAKAVAPPETSSQRAMTPSPRAQEVVERLRRAVFEEMQPVASLKREFEPVLHPKSDDQQALERLQRARAEARRLAGLLPELEGVSMRRVSEVRSALQALEADLERLITQARRASCSCPG
jgi:hypothetical protein